MTENVNMECGRGGIPDPGRPNTAERSEIARLSRRSDADIAYSVTAHDTAQQMGWGDGRWVVTTDQFGRPLTEWIVHSLQAGTAAKRRQLFNDSTDDYHPDAPVVNQYGLPFIAMCDDCRDSPAVISDDGFGHVCEVCMRRRERRGLS